MDVISISDSSDTSLDLHSLLLRYSTQKEAASPVSLSSNSTERCPVTWRSKRKKKIKLIRSEETPCANAKVKSWLTHNSHGNNFNTLQLEALDGSTVLRLEPLQKGGCILIRHDYNKDVVAYAKTPPFYDGIFSAKDTVTISSNDSQDPTGDCASETVLLDGVGKSRGDVADVTLSPETQKKNELCSYLQLMDMNCTDKKAGSAMQNRRSVRVQNLNMMSERKRLEKELLEVVTEEVYGNEKDLAKKSFAELKMSVPRESQQDVTDKSKKCMSTTAVVESSVFRVGDLQRRILENTVDFDDAIKVFFDAEKITVAKPKKSVEVLARRKVGARRKLLRKKIGRLKKIKPPEDMPRTKSKLLMSAKAKMKKTKTSKGTTKTKSELLTLAKARMKKVKSQESTTKTKCELLMSTKARMKLKRRNLQSTTNNAKDKTVSDSPNVTAVESSTVKTPTVEPQVNSKRASVSPQLKKKENPPTPPKKNKAISKCTKAFREKHFSIIDLSHQDYTTSGTLLDHNYASKPEIDKNYIMNVIVGQALAGDGDEKQGKSVTVTVQKPDAVDAIKETPPCEQAKLQVKLPVGPNTPKKVAVTPIRCSYTTPRAKNAIDDKPPVNIFDDSDYLKSPVILSETCMKDILGSLGTDSNEGGSPIIGRRRATPHYIPFSSSSEVKPLHKSLMGAKRKSWPQTPPDTTWDEKNLLKRQDEKRSHSIQISKKDGRILNAFYLDFNLIIAQEQVISFWSQSALGNMLGAQDMWLSKGSVQRLVTDGDCVFKKSPQAVISLENSVAYIELWIKEHKSDKRERPVADIFATIYFCRHRLNGPDKKVLQLENINGIASDVQYVVLRNSRHIIVSWCETCDDSRRTYIHCYNLASDYQTVVSIREMGNVNHYITSLHNIEDCDTLVMGCGEHKVSLWNVEYSYVVATIEINDIQSEPSTLWVKCDRGFLFMLQFYKLEKMFKLVAINGIHHSWKRLKMFSFPSGYKGLRGVCIDNNILGAFYETGVVCWNIQTGESVIEEMCSENVYVPCEKHVIILSQGGILVRHALSHFITSYDL